MSEYGDRGWVADSRIGWRILLTASLHKPVQSEELMDALAALVTSERWPGRPPLTAPSLPHLYSALVAAAPEPLLVGVHDRDVVLSAHHSAIDGLGLLSVMDRLGLGPARSSARGVGDRPTTGGALATAARRLGEIVFRPPAGVTPPVTSVRAPGDVLVAAEARGRIHADELVHAAAQAVLHHQKARGRDARHVAIAVGAVRAQAAEDERDALSDRSLLLRMNDVEKLDRPAVGRSLRTAPIVTPPVIGPDRVWSPVANRAVGAGLRLLAPRLGSTMLVSHLGEVEAPQVQRLAFHPVTAGGTGLSLGAVGHGGRTVLTLRARAMQWNDDGLEQLLETVISLL